MKTAFAIIGLLVVVLLVGSCWAVCNDDDDQKNSFGPIQLVAAVTNHYGDGGDCWDEYDCHGRDYGDEDGSYGDYGGNRYRNENGTRNDQRRCRGRGCRGSFSPGPFDRSPVTICAPYACNSGGEQSGGNRENPPPQNPPPEEEPMNVSCLVPVPFHCDPKPEVAA